MGLVQFCPRVGNSGELPVEVGGESRGWGTVIQRHLPVLCPDRPGGSLMLAGLQRLVRCDLCSQGPRRVRLNP